MTGRPLNFVKMHGAANDYVYVDCFVEPAPPDPAGIAPRISDRHRGVGGDGLVLVEPSARADARMRMFNADGSEAEMCGNAVRCVAHLLVDRGRAAAGTVTVETGRGVLALEVTRTGPRSSRVRVDMGAPILAAAEIPVAVPGDRVVDAACPALGAEQPWWRACGLDPRMTCVSMGNPHLVLFCRDVAAVPLETVGPGLETHAIFPRRINVHVVEVLGPAHVRMRTWERGSGITMACGTGAAAVCVAGALTGRTGRAIAADLPGGRLDLEWSPAGTVFMTGPADEAFTGTWWDA
ncbi:MAG: diaminopimelate epimerase [Planctomycetaceae bacterium]